MTLAHGSLEALVPWHASCPALLLSYEGWHGYCPALGSRARGLARFLYAPGWHVLCRVRK